MTARRRKEPPRGTVVVRLYVAGDSPNSMAAKANLNDVIARLPKGTVDVEFVDVLREPVRALTAGIVVTPTLVKVSPPPERRVIGNLRDRGALLAGLGIDETPEERGDA